MNTFDFTFSHAAEHESPLPDQADVVVIGGGVIGVMTAWYLHEAGQKVVLVEKGRIAGEQSSRNWGWVRQQGRAFPELPIAMDALSIWGRLSDEVGADLGFRRTGIMYIAPNRKVLAGYEAWLSEARGYGVDTRILSRKELCKQFPDAPDSWKGALYTPSDGRAEPWTAVPLIARALAARGAILRENCAARALDISGGAVSGVITEHGRIQSSRVILAGGAW